MSEIIEKETIKQALKPPVMWNVVFINDDFTPFDFVIYCLIDIFAKTQEQAEMIASDIHTKGKGIVGQYSKDIAQTKQDDAVNFARSMEHPLNVQIEPAG